jgi:AraC-like DNA-binding protein
MLPMILAGAVVERRPGHDTGWRQMPWAVLVTSITGPYRIHEEARRFDLAPGDSALIPPGLRHRNQQCMPGSVTQVAWLHLRCRLDEGDDLFERFAFPLRLREARLPRVIAQIVGAAQDIPGRLARLSAVCELLQILVPLGAVAATTHPEQERLAPTLVWAREHLADRLTRAALAHRSGLSEPRFHVVFQAVMRETPMAWLRRQRIERAQDLLLHSHLPVGEVALRCGFPDPFHFTRVFTRACGSSPRRWRVNS